jgi:hypothetical protein
MLQKACCKMGQEMGFFFIHVDHIHGFQWTVCLEDVPLFEGLGTGAGVKVLHA